MENPNSNELPLTQRDFFAQLYIRKIIPDLETRVQEQKYGGQSAVRDGLIVYESLFPEAHDGALSGWLGLLHKVSDNSVEQQDAVSADGLMLLGQPQIAPTSLVEFYLAHRILTANNLIEVLNFYSKAREPYAQVTPIHSDYDQVSLVLEAMQRRMIADILQRMSRTNMQGIGLNVLLEKLHLPPTHPLAGEFLEKAIGIFSQRDELPEAEKALNTLKVAAENTRDPDTLVLHLINLRWGLNNIAELVLKTTKGRDLISALEYAGQIDHKYFKLTTLIGLLTKIEPIESNLSTLNRLIVDELSLYSKASITDIVNKLTLQLKHVEELAQVDSQSAVEMFKNLATSEYIRYLLGSEEEAYRFLKIGDALGQENVKKIFAEVESSLDGYVLPQARLGQFRYLLEVDFGKATEIVHNISSYTIELEKPKFLLAYAKELIKKGKGYNIFESEWFKSLPSEFQTNLYAHYMFKAAEENKIELAQQLLDLIPVKGLIDYIRTEGE